MSEAYDRLALAREKYASLVTHKVFSFRAETRRTRKPPAMSSKSSNR